MCSICVGRLFCIIILKVLVQTLKFASYKAHQCSYFIHNSQNYKLNGDIFEQTPSPKYCLYLLFSCVIASFYSTRLLTFSLLYHNKFGLD